MLAMKMKAKGVMIFSSTCHKRICHEVLELESCWWLQEVEPGDRLGVTCLIASESFE